MSNLFEKVNEDYLIVGLLVVLLAILGTFYIDLGSIISGQDDGIYNIDTTDQWEESAGILWARTNASFANGQFTIRDYETRSYLNYSSAVNYRTSEVNATGEPLNLGNLRATGYVNQGIDSGLRLRIYDCSKNLIRRDIERLNESCFEGNEIYSTGLITDGGEYELDQDLSNKSINGYMHIELFVVSNATEKPDQPTNWDSISLNSNQE